MIKIAVLLALAASLLLPAPAYSRDPLAGSGLPLPRFASLRSNEVNLRTGPGTRYPIEWVFRQQGMPIEITAEFDIWRRVRDWEGTEGWVHKSTLSGRRFAIITGTNPQQIRTKKGLDTPIKALVEPSAIGKILSCHTNWCKVHFDDIKGYLPKSAFWGAYRGEQFE